MALMRTLEGDTLDAALRHGLTCELRLSDEATVLPAASRSVESGSFKNCVLSLAGDEAELDGGCFSERWYDGVAAVPVDGARAARLLETPEARTRALATLCAAIPSELADAELCVGPPLDCSAQERDTEGWTAGFDHPACSVGLYAAEQRRSADPSVAGLERPHRQFFLVCRAGGGVAATTFHSRLTEQLRAGRTLNEILLGADGARLLRRVASAGPRNRARLLSVAGRALGFDVEDLNDTAAAPDHPARAAITVFDVKVNTLRVADENPRKPWLYASGCVDGVLNNAVAVSSTLGEGYQLFSTQNNNYRCAVRNLAHNCVPFGTPRLATNKALAERVARWHRPGAAGHPDRTHVAQHFDWKNRTFGQTAKFEPASLAGSHAAERWVALFGRDLGLAALHSMRLQPELVAVAGMEASKLRALAR